MRSIFEYYENGDYLSHYGILGQKWGVRRFQNLDRTWTEEGKIRYGSGNSGRHNKKVENKKLIRLEKKWSKQDAKDNVLYEKISTKSKSKKRLQYEQEYSKKGMTKREAELAAYKKERAIKIAKVAGVVTLAAAVTYVGIKHRDKYIDRFLKAGVTLKRVSSSSDPAVRDGFYAVLSKNKMDVKKYAGYFAKELGPSWKTDKAGNIIGFTNPFQKTIGVGKGGIKIASEKSGIKALQKLISDDSSLATKATLRDALTESRKYFIYLGRSNNVKACEKAIKALDSGKINSDVYRGLISSMGPLGRSVDELDTLKTKLFGQLKQLGYHGVQDINDKYITGYRTKNPLIIFDAGNVSVKAVRQLTDPEIAKNISSATRSIYVSAFSPYIVSSGAAATTVALGAKTVSSVAKSKSRDKIVAEYRKEHPGTKLSYNEIVRNYYRNK